MISGAFTHSTRLLRASRLTGAVAGSALVLVLFAGGLFLAGVRMVSRYDE